MLALAFTALVMAAPPEEAADANPAARALLALGGAGVGAVVVGTAAAGTSFVVFNSMCAEQGCRDNPAFIVAPQAAIAGAAIGAVVGALVGLAAADAIGVPSTSVAAPQGRGTPPSRTVVRHSPS